MALATPEAVMTIEANAIGSFNVIRDGKAIGLVNWRVKIKNTSGQLATTLLVKFTDAKDGGNVLAADDRKVKVLPEETLTMEGFTDIPTADIARLKGVSCVLLVEPL